VNNKQLKELRLDTNYYATVCQNTLFRLRFEHHLKREIRPTLLETKLTGRQAWQKVNFDLAYGDHDVLWLHVDYRMPYGTKLTDLFNDEQIVQELALACQRPVEIKWSNKAGVWIVIYRRGSPSGVPSLFRFKEALPALTKNAHSLAFVVGAADKRQIIISNLERTRHLLVAGTTGGGKSVFLNQVLLTLLWRNHPDKLRVYLYDLKGGLELWDYRNLPHVEQIITEPAQCVENLAALHDELIKRQTLILGQTKSVSAWNKRYQSQPDKQIPLLVMVFDEFADLMLYRDFKGTNKQAKIAQAVLSQILAKGRALGMYAILCTQTPTREVIPMLVKNNCPARVAVNCANDTQSIVIVGNGSATGLKPRGRVIFAFEGDQVLIQTPYITDSQVKGLIRQVKDKWTDKPATGIKQYNWLEVLRYSRDSLDGSLSESDLYEYFSGDIPRSELRAWLSTIEERGVQFDGDSYEVQPAAGSRARQLIICEPKSNGNSAPPADRGEKLETVYT
jgi:DNA segregation ATPase FtsK/SpoIIIE-like protein